MAAAAWVAAVSCSSGPLVHGRQLRDTVSSDGSGLPILCVQVPIAIPVPAEPAALAEAAATAASAAPMVAL